MRGTPDAQLQSGGENPGETSDGGTPLPSTGTPSSRAATVIANAGGDIAGGDPSAHREEVGIAPQPPTGASIDPTIVAPPEPDVTGMQLIVDTDASAVGIQASRLVNEGDVFRVAIVVANPSESIATFNFYVDYNRNVALAPSYVGGPTTDRNPDLHEAAMGAGWSCLPAPEGDLDDAGGINGDDNPATGQAFISCFNPSRSVTGDVVLAVVEFRAIASGTLSLGLSAVSLGTSSFAEIGRCESDQASSPAIPCVGASVTVN